MNLLFWNAAKQPINSALADLVAESKADIVCLAEYEDDPTAFLHVLRGKGQSHTLVPSLGCKRVTLFANLPPRSVRHRRDGSRFTIKEIRPRGISPFLLVVLHLPSKLYATEDDQLYHATKLKNEIEETEKECGHRNTIVIGDFNMNPFDKGMVSAAAFNSLPIARIAQREYREIDGIKHHFFYNPSWNLLGDRNASPGTFFHGKPSSLSHYWNTLDQVIMRPGMASSLDKQSLRVISATGTLSLVNDDGRPTSSDHLPIALSLRPTW